MLIVGNIAFSLLWVFCALVIGGVLVVWYPIKGSSWLVESSRKASLGCSVNECGGWYVLCVDKP